MNESRMGHESRVQVISPSLIGQMGCCIRPHDNRYARSQMCAVTEEEGMKVNSDKTVDSAPKHQGRPAAIASAAAGLSNQMDPRLEVMVKCTLDLDDDEDDDIVNNKTKKAKRAQLQMMMMLTWTLSKLQHKTLKMFSLTLMGKKKRTNRTRKTASRICLSLCSMSCRKCTATKAAGLLSCLQMKIMSLGMN